MTDSMVQHRAVLEANFKVPAHLVSLQALEDFKATTRDRDGNEINHQFFDYDHETNCYVFARGNLLLIKKHFGHLDIEDRRASPIMTTSTIPFGEGHGIQFTGKLKPNQIEVANVVLSGDGFGQIEAPPRFGKTITMIYIATTLKMKTLFLSHQVDLAEQMLKSIYKFTNVIDLEYELNKKVVGIVDDWDDLDKYDIAVMTYQKFVSGKNAQEKLAQYRDSFGTIFIDESHRSTADRYSRIVSAFNAKFRMGVSGTIERKDNMHVVSNIILGPVVVTGKSEQVPCKVFAYRTNVSVPYSAGKMFFTQALNYLSKDRNRNDMLVSIIADYVKAGHYVIGVSDRIFQCEYIVEKLKSLGIVAESFHRDRFKSNKKAREECLKRCRSGETQVLIAYRTMTLGLDLPRFDTFVCCTPTANKPNYTQELNRVRTQFEGKKEGYIIDPIDNHHVLTACYLARKKVYEKENFEIKEL